MDKFLKVGEILINPDLISHLHLHTQLYDGFQQDTDKNVYADGVSICFVSGERDLELEFKGEQAEAIRHLFSESVDIIKRYRSDHGKCPECGEHAEYYGGDQELLCKQCDKDYLESNYLGQRTVS